MCKEGRQGGGEVPRRRHDPSRIVRIRLAYVGRWGGGTNRKPVINNYCIFKSNYTRRFVKIVGAWLALCMTMKDALISVTYSHGVAPVQSRILLGIVRFHNLMYDAVKSMGSFREFYLRNITYSTKVELDM